MVKKKAMPPDRPSREEEVKNEGCDRSGGTGLPWEREKGCSPFPTGAHAHHGLRDGERLTVSEGRKEAGPFPSDIPRARKPITVDNSQWKEQPWERAPKNQLRYGTGPSSQHVGRHVQQRTVPVGIILRHETVLETGIQDQFQIRFEPDVTQAYGQPIGFHAMLVAHDGNLIVNEERQIDETMALRSIDTDITIHPGRSETNAFDP